MKRRSVLSVAIVAFALSACAGASRVRQPIEGDWVITSATLAGQPLPPSAISDSKLHLDAGRYEFQNDRGDYVVLQGTPAALDIHGTDGPNAGRTILAIFRLKDDTMTIVYDLSGTTRPLRFESRPGTREYMVLYRRTP
jgi:uncharacterized protein (TIGR03067 family)